MTIIGFRAVIFGILILFITFRAASLFQNNVSNSSEISLTFSNDRVSKLSSWKHVYWRLFINALLLKFLYSHYCIIFTSCLLQKNFRISESHFMKIWWSCINNRRILKYSDLFTMISPIQENPFSHCSSKIWKRLFHA